METERRGRSRKKELQTEMKRGLAAKIAAVVGGVVLLGAIGGAGLYWHESLKYRTCFLPGTVVDGIDATGMTAQEVKDTLLGQLNGYTLTITGREDLSETLTGEAIGLYAEFDDSLETLIAEQKPLEWGKYLLSKKTREETLDRAVRYDEDAFETAILGLSCMQKENMREPEDAKISEYDSSAKAYHILEADSGTELLEDKVKSVISDAVESLAESVNLEEAGCYLSASVNADDESLQTACQNMNLYVGTEITYNFGDRTEVLNGDTIHSWISVKGTDVTLDETKVTEYVKNLASTYDTAYKKKELKTSYGKTVTITGGSYGWKIDQTKEAAALLSLIQNGAKENREPEYSQTAASRKSPDYGNTYVEINLTAQHLYYYVDGKLVVESDFVSGNASKNMATPAGAYSITYKQRNATLKGQGYSTPVSYWMPFNRGIGLHDASWRKTFGGTIYKTNGSHGCINLPSAVAKTIYENISAGTPVLCYQLDGTESGKTSAGKTDQTTETTAAATTAATTAAPTTAAATTAATTAAPETTAAPAGPSVEETTKAAETAPAVTAEGNSENFGPGFVTEAEGEASEPAVGPGY